MVYCRNITLILIWKDALKVVIMLRLVLGFLLTARPNPVIFLTPVIIWMKTFLMLYPGLKAARCQQQQHHQHRQQHHQHHQYQQHHQVPLVSCKYFSEFSLCMHVKSISTQYTWFLQLPRKLWFRWGADMMVILVPLKS